MKKLLLLVAVMTFCQSALAFNSNDEQIDHVLTIVESASQTEKLRVLERLQWSTLSDPRLFDTFEQALLKHYKNGNLDRDLEKSLLYQTRALGYSGNPKYKAVLKTLSNQNDNRRIRNTANRALKDFPYFNKVQELLANTPAEELNLPSEAINYLRLLKTENSYAQRLAARAMFHENRKEPELIEHIVANLKKDYMTPSLDNLKQDTLAWYCKVLKNVGGYNDLLLEVAENSPHRKIQKHAAKR